jgi:hypothetical protein
MNTLKKQETTLVQRACTKITGFKKLHKQLEKKIIVSGKSLSALNNCMRCIAHMALHFNTLPSQLDIEQIEEYLLMVKKRNTTSSESFFKHTICGCGFCFVVKVVMLALSSFIPLNVITNCQWYSHLER